MAFKGDDSTLSLATTVTLALAVAAMVFVKNPLQSSRPNGNGAGLYQTTGELKVPARLWEDPFAAVEKAVEASRQHFVQVAIDGRQVNVTASSVRLQAPRITGLDSLHQKIQEIDAHGKRILALIVMTGGGSSVEASEGRIRDRYAVSAALEAGCFAPDKGESLSYFIWKHIQDKSQKEKGLLQSTPFEWYSRNEIGTCPPLSRSKLEGGDDSAGFENVLVLWVKAQEDEDAILARVDDLILKLDTPSSKNNAKNGKIPLQLRLIGPRTSSELRRILKEIEQRLPSKEGQQKATPEYGWQTRGERLQVYSPWATAPRGLLSYGLKNKRGGEACDSYGKCKILFEHLLNTAGLDRSYLVTSDDLLFESLLKELHRRKVMAGRDRIVLIGEWDSFYARALPFTFLGAARQQLEKYGTVTCDSRGASLRSGGRHSVEEPCLTIDDGIDKVILEKRSLRDFNILQYSYLSGLDGETAEDQLKRTKSKKEEKGKDKTEEKDRFRDIDSYERPEGPSQLDYVRRLVARIKAECQSISPEEDKVNGKVKAIGILGQDTYDALLILQAVREQFPNALFFTTDLDARYFHEDEQKWTRNLIVAAQFGLQLDASLQHHIPPFRSSLQTSAFFAVLQAIGQISPLGPHNRISPRIFEIGRHGAVDLSADSLGKGEEAIHPRRGDLAKDQISFRLPSNIGLLWIVGILVVYLPLWCYGRMWNWLTAWNQSDSTIAAFLWMLRRVWVLIPIVGALWFWCHILHSPYAEEEPFSWSDGISVWPTEVLRLVAICLCLFFLVKAHADSVRNLNELRHSFFPDVAREDKNREWRKALNGFWGDLKWMFHGSMQTHSNGAKALWVRYCRAHEWPRRFGRVALELMVYLGVVVPLWFFMNDGELRLSVPCRGDFTCQVDLVVTLGSVWLLLILNVTVLDAVILCARWIQEMPVATGVNESLSELQRIRLIVERTRILNRRILYPFLVLFLLIAARSHYFDNWDFPPVLILVLAVNTLVALASVSMLYLAAVQAKRRMVAGVQAQLDQALAQTDTRLQPIETPSNDSVERLRQMITDIDAVQQGAFVPFYQQPVIQATLVAALAFLQYWYLGQ